MLHDDSDGSVPPRSRERIARRAPLVFLAALLLAPGCATFEPARIEAERAAERLAIEIAARADSGFVGVYSGQLPAVAGSGRSVTLELRADGRAQLVNVYLGRGLRAERGRWFATGDTLRIEWESVDEAIIVTPTEWVRSGSDLVPTAWDPGVWGKVGLPLSRWDASHAARADCTWRPFADATLALRLLVESCAEGVPGSRFTTRGAEIVDVSGVGEGERGTPVIQVFSKRADAPMDAAIRARFFPEMVPRMREGCRVIRIRFENGDEPDGRETWEILPAEEYEEDTAKWRAAEPAAMVCGPYGQRNGRGYFEFHPSKSKTRYLFVWLGAGEPRFDERSIELLD